VRPLLAARGCTVECGLPLRTLAHVIAYLGANRQFGRLDATKVRGRRPAAHKAGRYGFVPGRTRANTVKALVITDADGRLLFCGQIRPGSTHDLTQVRQAGLVELLVDGVEQGGVVSLGEPLAPASAPATTPTPPPRR